MYVYVCMECLKGSCMYACMHVCICACIIIHFENHVSGKIPVTTLLISTPLQILLSTMTNMGAALHQFAGNGYNWHHMR